MLDGDRGGWWSKSWWDGIRQRVERRAAELGRSVRSLMRDADVTVDILYRAERAQSPKINTLQKIANATGLTLPQILGFEDPAKINSDVIEIAVHCCYRAARGEVLEEKRLSRMLDAALNLLLAHRQRGFEIDDPATIALVEEAVVALVRQNWEAGPASARQTPAPAIIRDVSPALPQTRRAPRTTKKP